jgi:hypothetical protein
MHIYDYFKGQREENTKDGTHKKLIGNFFTRHGPIMNDVS